jgi:glycosyltransferase involved in cell wall biosynthesis
MFGEGLRNWDRKTVANVDAFIANSRHTAKEIERCFGREAVVIHPPVRTDLFTPDQSVQREDFWLVAGAHEPYKRTDLAIESAMRAGKRLMVAGGGSEIGALKAFTKKTSRQLGKMGFGAGRHALVEFLGRVDDATLLGLYRRARCLIYPQIEDFGIVAVEAQACGCPVVARRAGGALDTVLEGRTGSYFAEADPESVRKAVEHAPVGVAAQCRAHAEKFSEAAFDKKIARAMERMVG